jgi:WD40 repeat protein
MNLKYVPCYNGRTGRHNIEFVEENQIVFFTSSFIVIMNINTFEQTILQGHTNEITSMAYCEDQCILVTGQKKHPDDEAPFYIVWDLSTHDKLAVIECHQSEISCITLDRLGKYITTIGAAEDMFEMKIWSLLDVVESYRTVDASTTSIVKVKSKPLENCVLGPNQIHTVI